MSDAVVGGGRGRGHGWWRRVLLRRTAAVVGIALLAAAVVLLWRRSDMIAEAMGALARPAPGTVALLLGAVVANVVLTGLLFSVLMAPYGRVPLLEMQAMIAGATLANYLPLRPGLVGRVVYHRTVHGIPATRTGVVVVGALLLTSGIAAILAAAAGLARMKGWPVWMVAAAPAPVLLAGIAWPWGPGRGVRRWCVAGLIRHADVLVWAVRYDAAFRLIDAPIAPDTALALACVSVVTMLVPIASNGLGLREWAIGLFAPFLGGRSLELGLTADLVNRAAEVLVIVVLGAPALMWLLRKASRHRRIEASP